MIKLHINLVKFLYIYGWALHTYVYTMKSIIIIVSDHKCKKKISIKQE